MKTAEFEQLVKPIALIVDDEPLILLDTADMISDEGYSVVESLHGRPGVRFPRQTFNTPASFHRRSDARRRGRLPSGAHRSGALAAHPCRDIFRGGRSWSRRSFRQRKVHSQIVNGRARSSNTGRAWLPQNKTLMTPFSFRD